MIDYLAMMRQGHSYAEENPRLFNLAVAGYCSRHVAPGKYPDMPPLYYVAHICQKCHAISIGISQDEPLCTRCAEQSRRVAQ